MKPTTIHLREETLEELKKLSKASKKHCPDLIREAVRIGLHELRLRHTFDLYQRGSISFGRLSELTGISHQELYEELKRRGIHCRYPENDLEKIRQ
jgi:predicted HTH domain antitoxin